VANRAVVTLDIVRELQKENDIGTKGALNLVMYTSLFMSTWFTPALGGQG